MTKKFGRKSGGGGSKKKKSGDEKPIFEPKTEISRQDEVKFSWKESSSESRIERIISGEPIDPDEQRESIVQGRDLLIASWNARDELYRELFGDYAYVVPDSYAAPPSLKKENVVLDSERDVSSDTANPGDPDLADQHLCVLAYAPDVTRHYWLYVTAGLSSPWLQDKPDEVSGFGCELMIKSPTDAAWAPQILRAMAFYIFNHAGTLSPGARIDLHAPIKANSDSKIRNLFIWYADEAPDCWYILPSGGFGLFMSVGMTADELKYAESVEEYGTWCIQQVLRHTGHGQITDPDRNCVMEQEDIGGILNSVRMFADTFRANIMQPEFGP